MKELLNLKYCVVAVGLGREPTDFGSLKVEWSFAACGLRPKREKPFSPQLKITVAYPKNFI
ncbi:MAG: hypothetical protein QXY07_04020 [Candidatus Bathyarchaeia archaeon]